MLAGSYGTVVATLAFACVSLAAGFKRSSFAVRARTASNAASQLGTRLATLLEALSGTVGLVRTLRCPATGTFIRVFDFGVAFLPAFPYLGLDFRSILWPEVVPVLDLAVLVVVVVGAEELEEYRDALCVSTFAP